MKAYELLLMINPTSTEDQVAAYVEKARGLITADGGVVDNTDDWGKRKLAYEIDKLNDAYYVLVEFHSEPAAIAEIDRVLRITDGVMRFMISCRSDKE